MSFKPKNTGKPRNEEFEPRVMVVPKAGARKARVSLIVDLGIQKRDDFEDETSGEKRAQKPCQQIAVFADLVNDVVDYGGKIGKAQYRLMLNKQFAGEITGINFTTTPPKDKDGKIIDGRPRGFHPRNRLTELCKACGRPDVAVDAGEAGLDISLLLGLPFIAEVEVNEKVSEKKDKDGNAIVYKNVNYKGASAVPMVETDELDEDGNAIEVVQPVAELRQPPRLISFETATVEDIQFIRLGLLKMIKQAEDYAGSAMQAAVEAYEAQRGGTAAAENDGEPEPQTPEETKTKVTPPKAAGTKKTAEKKPIAKDGPEEDVPF